MALAEDSLNPNNVVTPLKDLTGDAALVLILPFTDQQFLRKDIFCINQK